MGCIVRRPGNVRGSAGFVVWPKTDTENITWVEVATCAAHIRWPGHSDLMGRGLTVELIKRIGGSHLCTLHVLDAVPHAILKAWKLWTQSLIPQASCLQGVRRCSG
jgi:hypothetical protein